MIMFWVLSDDGECKSLCSFSLHIITLVVWEWFLLTWLLAWHWMLSTDVTMTVMLMEDVVSCFFAQRLWLHPNMAQLPSVEQFTVAWHAAADELESYWLTLITGSETVFSTVSVNAVRTSTSKFERASYCPPSYSWRSCMVKDQSETFRLIRFLYLGDTPCEFARKSFLLNRLHTASCTCDWFLGLMLSWIELPFNP